MQKILKNYCNTPKIIVKYNRSVKKGTNVQESVSNLSKMCKGGDELSYFKGKGVHTIDSKGRIIIPAKFRDGLGEQFVIAEGTEGCLFVYPEPVWEEVAKAISSIPGNTEEARFLQRRFIGGAEDAQTDKQGKVLITPEHRKYAQLEKELSLVE